MSNRVANTWSLQPVPAGAVLAEWLTRKWLIGGRPGANSLRPRADGTFSMKLFYTVGGRCHVRSKKKVEPFSHAMGGGGVAPGARWNWV